jgi:hypothetical protein
MERSKKKLTEVSTNKVTTKVNLLESVDENSIALEWISQKIWITCT